jgi:hypothetical protein
LLALKDGMGVYKFHPAHEHTKATRVQHAIVAREFLMRIFLNRMFSCVD